MARAGLRSHLSGSVPISIGLHLVAVILFLIIPLTANIEMPDPAMSLPDYMPTAPMPPPPPAAPMRPAAAPAANPATTGPPPRPHPLQSSLKPRARARFPTSASRRREAFPRASEC